ncbi:tRNA epoxyqueuosine(34) reductase QueG [Porticoccus sp. W117]|uniref:tRNA epoxyqueuosine(34) reductase QueG n=1 Tax=Porticoccus sp. W117 TaxID=3054777 RepID=UPI002597F2E1|nr:tRNA epoxyqueuosine(34) reductase QueG [Porticoccus sp. W117]MDM3871557.1 tRNA epoxyqueuosine(34) reductase QueG [Porticoccus sp. W117]
MKDTSAIDYTELAQQIKTWGQELGFQQVAITDVDLSEAGQRLRDWLDKGYQGEMGWMADHGDKRYRPEHLHPGTLRVISVRMDYLSADSNMIAVLKQPDKAYISRYALGRDYHKLIRKRLAKLAQKIEQSVPHSVEQRPFVDSAPVMEKALAEKAGLGWVGKNSLVLNSHAGSWFFLGEIFTNLPLPIDQSTEQNQCGKCKACLTVCPTDAFPEPYVLDARRCISYLTIELKDAIPEEFREPMGNRVFGCDDCQAMCPWNRFAKASQELDFLPRHQLDSTRLVDLFNWTEAEFLERTAGSPIRRIGYERWLRNLAVGLGNAPSSKEIIIALEARRGKVSEMVWEHIEWALKQHDNRRSAAI